MALVCRREDSHGRGNLHVGHDGESGRPPAWSYPENQLFSWRRQVAQVALTIAGVDEAVEAASDQEWRLVAIAVVVARCRVVGLSNTITLATKALFVLI